MERLLLQCLLCPIHLRYEIRYLFVFDFELWYSVNVVGIYVWVLFDLDGYRIFEVDRGLGEKEFEFLQVFVVWISLMTFKIILKIC